MAVEVEDHPVDYASFEGEIPRGEYGGGHVAQFDHGVWSSEDDPEVQLAKGHLRFELFGKKLRGAWHLVRSGKPAKQPQWLLFKDDDEYAGTLEADDLLGDVTPPPPADAKRAGTGKRAKKGKTEVKVPRKRRARDWAKLAGRLPGARRGKVPDGPFEPQLARLGDAPPQGEHWLHEIKWDGYRILVTIADGEVRLWSRNALEWTGKVPEIVDALGELGLKSAALDGELIAGGGTKQDFNLLQATLSGEKQGALSLVLFDLLHVNGMDISEVSLKARKALLEEILGDPPTHLAYSSHVEGNGDDAYAMAGQQHFEGIISKRGDRAHHPGRSDDWRKTKQLTSDEFAVVGWTPPKGGRSGFGSLLLAKPDVEHGWRYAGRVGTGFSDEMLREVAKGIGEAGGAKPTVFIPENDTDLRKAKWFKPRFVVEVFYRGTGGSSLLRQASLKAVRPDKNVADLTDSDRDTLTPTSANRKGGRTKGAARKAREAPELSSPTKILYPDIHATKQDVADYYQRVMDFLLPEIAGRPLSIIRCPNGTEKPCFFQKHHTPGLELVSFSRLKEEAGNNADYLVVNDAAGVMELVQFNALEFHPWGSRADSPDLANRVVFDLDPGPGVAWPDVVAAARHVRKLLESVGLESFVRTSGGKGLHVVVPLKPGCDWDLVKPFAHAFAEGMAKVDPLKYVSTSSKRFRTNRIFVDYLRNGRGATSVASFSLRARPGAPVAMPLRWEELGKIKSSTAFDIRSAVARISRLRKHPWAGIERVKQDLSRWSQ